MDKIFCLTGPTCSGKNFLVKSLAKHWPIEIINIDSASIYRGMDIGTAKPSQEERLVLKHHLIDIKNPNELFSVSDFVKITHSLIKEIKKRNHFPILVGGTMMYINILINGLNILPGRCQVLRNEINDRARIMGWEALHSELEKIDPSTASNVSKHDSQRIQRAIEVYESSNKTLSEWLIHGEKNRLDLYLVSLEPSERQVLYNSIASRFEKMMSSGLMQEVEMLHKMKLPDILPSTRCIGYRQLLEYLNNKISLDEAKTKSIQATKNLAKRQITWLRNKIYKNHTIDCINPTSSKQIVDTFNIFLKKN